MRINDYLKSGLKSLTDPGFLFNAGNVLPVLGNIQTAAITLSVAVLCAAIRFANELEEKGINLPLPAWAKNITQNPGTTLQLTGLFLGVAAFSAIPHIKAGNPDTYFTPIFSGALGIGNIALGKELNSEQGSMLRRIFNSIGQVAISGALVYASQDAPLFVQAFFGASGALAIALNVTNRQSLGIVTPNRLNALGAASNIIVHPALIFKAANACWTAAYISLDHAQRQRPPAAPDQPTAKNEL